MNKPQTRAVDKSDTQDKTMDNLECIVIHIHKRRCKSDLRMSSMPNCDYDLQSTSSVPKKAFDYFMVLMRKMYRLQFCIIAVAGAYERAMRSIGGRVCTGPLSTIRALPSIWTSTGTVNWIASSAIFA